MRDILGTENISKSNGYFRVMKYFNHKTHFVGTCKTLIQALMMRDWAEQNNWQHYPKKTVTGEKYITRTNSGTYVVGKKINGKTHYYGGFKTLEDAIVLRDECIKHGWSSNHKYKNPNRNIRKIHRNYEVYHTVNGKPVYYGGYPTLEHAREVRDLAEKYDGDWDLMCEHDDGERAWLTGLKPRDTMFEKVDRQASDVFRAKHLGLLKVFEEE